MKVRFIPLQSAISDFLEDLSMEEKELDEELIKKWARDAIRMFTTDEQLVHKIGLYDVSNYKANLPDDLQILCEVAYRLEKPKNCGTKRERIIQWTQWADEDCELEINLKCPKCKKTECSGCGDDEVIVDVDRIWELSNAHFNYPLSFGRVHQFGKGHGYKEGDSCFRLLPCSDSHFDHISRHISDCANLNCPKENYSYQLNLPNIEVNFEKGELIVAYLGKKTDESGEIMIPDHIDAILAVQDYITYRYLKKRYLREDSKAIDVNKAQIAKSDWLESLSAARSALQVPSFTEFSKWMRNNPYYKVNQGIENLYERGHSRKHHLRDRGRYRNPLRVTDQNVYKSK